jgi:signal transduction histidine kinase
MMAKGFWSRLEQFLNKRARYANGHRLSRYGLPIALVSIVFLFKITFFALIQQDVPFLLSSLIIIISAWYGGLGPGIIATLLAGALTNYFFLAPKGSFIGSSNIGNFFVMTVFFVEGILISIISEARHKSDIQKSEFIGIVSHELKNPLTSIKGYAELIQRQAEKKKDKQIGDFAGRINAQIGTLTQMVNELLDVTKIETGRLTYRLEDFAIGDVVADVVADQQVTTSHKITLKGDSKRIIYGDQYRIRQVVTNLLSNAVKYSPKAKKVNVTIKDGRGSVLITVQDFGAGIPQKDLTRVFNPFYRTQKSRESKVQGTGIGLFISSQIVQKHSGKLWGTSTVGKGSTFYLRLPTVRK